MGRLKHILGMWGITFLTVPLLAQTPPRQDIDPEELIERIFPVPDDDLDYETIYEVLLQLYLTPISINSATAEALQSTYLLTARQIESFLSYRDQQGPFLSLYELQAIPDWDLDTIRKILPFVSLENPSKQTSPFWNRIKEEEQSYLIFRHRTVWERRKGFTPADTSSTGKVSSRYLGDPHDLYLRFRTQHNRDFSIGFTLDKDAGEQWIWDPKTRRYGFNFASFHAQRYEIGNWKTLALGDYQASFGQGLVMGAGYNLGKGAETVSTVRRSSVGILPYTAALESGFFRGAAATYQKNNWQVTALLSAAPRDGRAELSADSLNNESEVISSFNRSGLHRTPSELSTKGQFREMSLGGAIQYQVHPRLSLGATYLHNQFSRPWIPRNRLYNQFEFTGQSNQVGSVYFSYNWTNFLFFGEHARSKSGGTGSILGFLSSLSPKVDLSLLWRSYDRNFHSFYGNPFSENTRPINERGTYLGLEIRPVKSWKINAYVDVFHFPWLKYRVYRPSQGYEWLGRLSYRPKRSLQVFLQWKEEHKQRNLSNQNEPNTPFRTSTIRKRSALLNLDFTVSRNLFLRNRIWWTQVSFDQEITQGWMIFQDVQVKGEGWKITGRYALFDTGNYDSRIYTFENHVLWTFSIPAFSGQGQRYYLLGNYDVSRKLRLYLRFARTTYTDRERISSGLQEIRGNTQSETTLLLRYYLNR